jgi:hypothetical protein
MWVGGQDHGPAALTPIKRTGTNFIESWKSIWTGAENLTLTEIQTRTVQPVAIGYIDCAINTPDEIFTTDHIDVNTHEPLEK